MWSSFSVNSNIIRFFKNLFLESREGGDREREGEKHRCEKHQMVASCTCLDLELNPQLRQVPWLGMELATFHFLGQCPTNWAIPVRACILSSIKQNKTLMDFSLIAFFQYCFRTQLSASPSLNPCDFLVYMVFDFQDCELQGLDVVKVFASLQSQTGSMACSLEMCLWFFFSYFSNDTTVIW